MNDDQAYDKLLSKLKELPAKKVRSPDMPVNEAVSEGEKMAVLCKEDKAFFEPIGFDMGLANECAAAAGALRVADGKRLACLGEKNESRKEWDENEAAGYELRDDTLAALSYALRKNNKAMRIVRKIRHGGSDRDMIHDLRAEKELGIKYPDELMAILFDMAILDRCGNMADRLGTLYAKAFVDTSGKEALDIRNRAFTYMRSISSEILDAAEFVLRDNPERIRQYYSDYRRRQYRSREEQETDTSPETPETPEM